MSSYALFHIAVALPPLIAALWPWKFAWSKEQWQQFGTVILFVSIPWILLDAWSHSRGWWAYTPEHVGQWHILGLPIEEILFFVTVPFACMFLLTSLRRVMPHQYVNRKISSGLRYAIMAIAVASAGMLPYERTLTDASLVVIVCGVSLWVWRTWTHSDIVWWCCVIALFFICNTILTAVPIVVYDHAYGSMVRLGTIPLEDLWYNLSLLGCTYIIFMRPWRSSQPQARR